jgi:hypothetical protein
MSTKLKKVTVHLPEDLLNAAVKQSDGNITEAIRMGLKLIAAKSASEDILSWRNKYKFQIDYKKLRKTINHTGLKLAVS